MTSVLTIDILQETDKEAVGRLLVESYSQYQNSYAKLQDWLAYASDLKASVNNPLVDRFLVAKDGEKVLGTLQLFTNSETAYNRPELEISSPIIRMLAVNPEARGKGIAQALMKESINYAQENGADHVYLHTSDKMAEAIRLYEWLGFKRDTSKEFYKLNFLVKCYRLDI
ncbi:GNAT family N-acetyltransferase [Psychrobacillus sp. OK032]|uniref:GNAT family N-acetyltransferase n=1 Tax=Psychrobacillus sp. OK032 TaxID=1884358 RepID=UPI0008C5F866|nr:GNAT family N-acetyltransferase [Psychrobacillus sp. OK032]SER99968.1 Acetyltransferase (GNAT) family protein [Psychrobacillus sp. OK032]